MNKKLLKATSDYICYSILDKATIKNFDLYLSDNKSGIEIYAFNNIIVFMASNESRDWKTNFKISKMFSFKRKHFLDNKIKSHKGYTEGFNRIEKELIEYIKYFDEVYLLGFSMGFGVGQIAALDIKLITEKKVYLSGSGPSVFNKYGAKLFNLLIPDTLRFMYGNDIVAKIPPKLFFYYPVGEYIHIGPKRRWFINRVLDHNHCFDIAYHANLLYNGEQK